MVVQLAEAEGEPGGPMTQDPIAVIEGYLAAVSDMDADAADVAAFIHPDARFVERPNRIAPTGRRRDAPAALAALGHSRRLMREHRFEIHDHLVAGERVVTRARWTGVLAIDAGELPAGTELRADCCMVFTVRGGRVLEQENYDCYHPFEILATAT
jgi:ketosteroid isomerase-like protein